jgi:hypothetical protein
VTNGGTDDPLQFESFVPTWGYDEPKKKKKRPDGTPSKRSKGEKSSEKADASEKAEPSTGKSTATPAVNGTATDGDSLRSRKAATIEEINDDDE